ncbi:MAG TPA: aminotransferase class III-fold pyridoxal phosphate-dependent enzyme [Solirubrobacterales bacterium]|jgi:4-aminobutyrate aminotransferase-like enzyme
MRAAGETPPLRIADGRGARIELDNGQRVIDAGSISATLLGHRHPDLVAAIQRTAEDPYVSDGWGHAPREQAARDLLEIGFEGEDWPQVVRFCTSASEANDIALHLTRTITGRAPLVSRAQAYHGALGLAREASNHPLWNGNLASPEGGFVEPPPIDSGWRTLAAPAPGSDADPPLEGAAEVLAGAAAVISDYGSNGVIFPSASYQDELAAQAAAAGAIWISDEAVTGLGRLGRSFAFQQGHSRPGIVTLGKGMTGGAAPGGAVVLSADVVEAMGGRRWMTYSTFRGHPLTSAAVSTCMRVIKRDGLIERAREVGTNFGRSLRQVAAGHDCVLQVVGEGLLWAIELDGDPEHASARWHGDGRRRPLAEVVTAAALERGAIMSAYSGLVVWLVPPLVIETEELEEVTEILDAALSVADAERAARS